MNKDLFLSILAMDSYNRGYDANINLSGNQIGNAIKINDSLILGSEDGERIDVAAGFYALTYNVSNVEGFSSGDRVVSYRGTDDLQGPDSADFYAGWTVGVGYTGGQAKLALDFYTAATGQAYTNSASNTVLTGQSLGGGLAGFVSALSGTESVIFDHMPFGLAAFIQSDFGSAVSPQYSLPRAYHVDGEALEDVRSGLVQTGVGVALGGFSGLGSIGSAVAALAPLAIGTGAATGYLDSGIVNTSIGTWGADVPTGDEPGVAVPFLGSFYLHQPQPLVILMFGQTEVNSTDWHEAAPYLVPALFDQRIGAIFGPRVGSYQNYKILSAIAYSAIDEGVKPYGDVGIHSLFNDANDLGKVLGHYNTSSNLTEVAGIVSKSVVEFAGKLALGSVEGGDESSLAAGILSLASDEQSIAIDFSNDLWAHGSNPIEGGIIGKPELYDNVFPAAGFVHETDSDYDEGIVGIYRATGALAAAMDYLWADDSSAIIDRIVLATKAGPASASLQERESESDKKSLFVGGDGNDSVWGSEKGELLAGGAGNDLLAGGGGGDILSGGAGTDTVDYSTGDAETMTFSLGDNADFLAVMHPPLEGGSMPSGQDLLVSIERIYGTDAPDRIEVHELLPDQVNPIEYIDLGNNDGSGSPSPVDTVDASELGSGVTIDLSSVLAQTLQQEGVQATLHMRNVEGAVGTDHDDTIKGISAPTSGASGSALKGGDGNDHLFGGSGNDRLEGEEGDDTLEGSGGTDILDGGEGDDRILGGAGLDTITGGAGNDTIDGGDDDIAESLEGGAGTDYFVWRKNDVVTDPSQGDRLLVSGDFLTGGTVIEDEDGNPTNQYRGAKNEIYSASGADLTIELANGETMTIQNWSEGKLGIGLSEEPPPPRDPLVLDLDGDGLELSSYAESSTFFDIDDDDIAERMAWTKGGDGFLAMDQNGDGKITKGSELFTFSTLSTYDSNGDRVIDINDPAYSQLKVWRDSDLDGITSAGELQSLANAGIQRISLLTRSSTLGLVAGNFVLRQGSFTRTDGTVGNGYDVNILFSNTTTQSIGLPPPDPETLALPQLFGRGNVLNLADAMTADSVLKGMVSDLATMDISDVASFGSKVEAIIYRWHGVESVNASSRGIFIDARQNAALEELRGQIFLNGEDLYWDEASLQIKDWHTYSSIIASELLAQLPVGQELFPGLEYQMGAFLQLPPETSLTEVLSNLVAHAPSGEREKFGYWSAMSQVLGRLKDQFVEDGDEFRAAVNSVLSGEGLPYTYAELRDAAYGSAGDDVLYGAYEEDYDPAVFPDMLIGGTGNDTLRGGTGSDHYIFGLGDGQDLIIDETFQNGLDDPEWIGEDSIRFLSGIAPEDLVFEKPQGTQDLLISIAGTTDKITIRQQFENKDVKIDRFEFADGTVLAWSDIASEFFPAGAGNDYVVGSNMRDETLAGGAGTDTLEGGAGDDTYIFNRGDGTDTIIESYNNQDPNDGYSLYNTIDSVDRIVFGEGILPSDVQALTDPSGNIIFVIKDTGDRLLVRDGVAENGRRVELFQFQDGTEWTWQQIVSSLRGSSPYNDSLTGGFGDDTLDGGAGSDQLQGRAGSDVYIFGRGYGRDTIYDDGDLSGSDVVQFGPDITASDLIISGDGYSLFFQIKGTTDVLTVQSHFYHWETVWMGAPQVRTPNKIEEFRFSDGSLLTENAIKAAISAGTSEDDALYGTAGDDTLDGGLGSDTILGYGGADTFLFGLGSGEDTIYPTPAYGGVPTTNRVVFGPSIESENLIFASNSIGNLVIRVADGTDVLTISSFMTLPGDSIDVFEFDDGTTLTEAAVRAMLVPTEGDDVLFGTSATDEIYGGSGNDLLTGLAADDTLHGGQGADSLHGSDGNDLLYGDAGNDVLYGESGNDYLDGGAGDDELRDGYGVDTFVFGLGSGDDTVFGTNFDDIVSFGVGISSADLAISRFGSDLILSVIGTSDVLTINSYFSTYPDRMKTFQFSDSSTLNHATIMNHLLSSTNGNDTLVGDEFSNIISAGGGNDSLDGASGDDYFTFGRNYGIDFASGSYGADTLVFTPDVAPSDVAVSFYGGQLTFSIVGTADAITTSGVEYFKFADGTEWDQQLALAHIPITSGNDTLQGGQDADQISGGGGNDALWGDGGNDLLHGDAGNDYLNGQDGNDTLDGGSGNDSLSGDYGADTYLFNRGDGQDKIYEDYSPRNEDIIQFASDIAPEDVVATRLNSDLIFSISGTSDSITIVNFFGDLDARIEKLKFSDGTIWLSNAFLSLVETNGNDSIRDDDTGNLLQGLAGADNLYGNGGDDTLDGGAGDDWLDGGWGSNTYLFARGGGHDTMLLPSDYEDENQLTSILQFGQNIAINDLSIAASGTDDLTITINGTTDSVTLVHYFNSAYRPDFIKFDDGLLLTHDMVMNAIIGATSGSDVIAGDEASNILSGGSGNDTLSGRDGDDVLDGGAGQDSLIGGTGSDLYRFEAGFGQDRLFDSGQYQKGDWDSIVFGDGILSSDVQFSRQANDLIISFSGSTDKLTVERYFEFAQYRFESLHFADGVIYQHNDIMQQVLQSTAGNDVLTGDEGSNSITSGLGNDTISGTAGDDILDGGAGNDSMTGGDGADYYIFNVGYGSDIINELNPSYVYSRGDMLLFGDVINSTDLVLSRSGTGNDDLTISLINSSDSITIKGYLGESASTYSTAYFRNDTIEKIQFFDGTLLSHSEIMSRLLVPTGGNDTLIGDERGNVISGDAGNDVIDGRSGSDLLSGGLGDDQLTGGYGDDTLSGGLGNDQLLGGGGADTYRFDIGDGNDTVSDTINVSGETDTLVFGDGISPNDVVLSRVGDGANDLKFTLGSDSLTIQGYFNPDGYSGQFYSTRLIESVRFTDGTAWNYGTIFNMLLTSSSGNDSLYGDAAANTIVGGAGDDYLEGRWGNDLLQGDDGNDTLQAGVGSDTLYGGTGDDLLYYSVSSSDLDYIDGGAGTDTAAISSDSSGTIDLTATTGDVFVSIENVKGGSYQDTLIGNDGDNLIQGMSGDDVLTGNGGNDTLNGSDTYGEDTLSGGLGDDSYIVDGWDTLIEAAAAGYDQVSSSASFTLSANIEDLTLTGTAATGNGNASNNIILGNASNNTLRGYAGQDSLNGGLGADTLVGGTNDDTLIGGDGNDYFDIAAGDGIDVFDGGLGTDTIRATNANAVIGVSSLSGIETITGNGFANVSLAGTAGDDTLNLAGMTLTSITRIDGNAGNDAITGNSVANVIYGGADADTLDGGAGNDSIMGDDGADSIIGSAGDDTLIGGNGDDIFGVVGSGDGLDSIDGGAGSDILQASADNTVIGLKALAGIETITANGFSGTSIAGTTGNDTLNFSSVTLTGIGQIDAGAGADTITGSSAADTIIGGTGDDSLVGGDGDDLFQISGTGAGFDAIDGGTGTDTIQATAASTIIGLKSLTGVEAITAGALAGVSISGTTTNDSFDLSATTLTGITKIDLGSGNDTLIGSADADTILGSGGDDSLTGDAGNDSFQYTGTSNGFDAVDGGSGTDAITALANSTVIGLSAVSGIETVSAGAFTGVYIAGSGNADSLDFSAATMTGITKIDGGSGNDTIVGSGGADTILGSAGDDVINAGGGADSIQYTGTSNGFDSIDGGAGTDTITPLANSTVIGLSAISNVEAINASGKTGVYIAGSANADVLDFSATTLTLITKIDGGSGNDTITGSSAADTIVGSAGDDSLVAGAGNDSVTGDDGNDTLTGSAGDDTLQGGNNDDVFYVAGSGDGLDSIDGGAGSDTILATAINTVIGLKSLAGIETINANGFSGASILATTGNDTLNFASVTLTGITQIDAGAGIDTITGSGDADTIIGGAGDDVLSGGAGDDVFQISGTGAGLDSLDGGNGSDTVLATAANTTIGLKSLASVETISANGLSGVSIAGTANNDALDFSAVTLSGITRIDSAAGNDTITGSGDADTILGSGGDDSLSGSGGDDVFQYTGTSNGFDAVSGGSGTDTISALANSTVIGLSSLSGIEAISAGAFTGVYIAGSGNADNLDFSATTLTAITKTDGGAGNDTIVGTGNADTILGSAGDDSLNGGGGNDAFQYTGTSNGFDAVDGGAGSDIISALANSTIIGLASITGVETISGGSFTGVSIAGSGIADTLDFGSTTLTAITKIDGGAGNDTITGSGAADTILGSGGDDSLAAGGGNDVIQYTGAANGFDAVDGGAGTDTLSALANNTVIGLSSLTGVETISGGSFTGVYVQGSGNADTLNLSSVTLTAITRVEGGAGNDAITGNTAANTLWGGLDADTIDGGSGNDTIVGDDGDDVITGGAGNDSLNGANGTDTVDYSYATANLTVSLAVTAAQTVAASDVDTLSNFENLTGGTGADTLTGSTGSNVLKGGSGNDRITGDAGNDSIDGGVGATDVAVFAGLQASYTLTTVDGTTTVVDDQPATDGDDGTDTLVGVETVEFKGGVQVNLATPIALDLDGDGVELVDKKKSKASFDWDGDGDRDKTGWVGKDDGLLVFDRNGDGSINAANELSFVDDKPGAKSDLDGLSAFDSNHDGIFSGDDDAFASFGVWRDRNGDGQSQKSELMTLADAGVASINLAGTAVNREWGWNDNLVINTGSFTRTDGSEHAFGDIALNYSESKGGRSRYAPSVAASRFAEAIASFRPRGGDEVTLGKHDMELTKVPVFAGEHYRQI